MKYIQIKCKSTKKENIITLIPCGRHFFLLTCIWWIVLFMSSWVSLSVTTQCTLFFIAKYAKSKVSHTLSLASCFVLSSIHFTLSRLALNSFLMAQIINQACSVKHKTNIRKDYFSWWFYRRINLYTTNVGHGNCCIVLWISWKEGYSAAAAATNKRINERTNETNKKRNKQPSGTLYASDGNFLYNITTVSTMHFRAGLYYSVKCSRTIP